MDVQRQFYSLAQIAPPHHSISPAVLPATISPAAISIKSEHPLITVSDVNMMDSDSDPSSGSDMDDDDEDDEEDDEGVDDSYKERSRGKRTGPPGSKSQRSSGAASSKRRASKVDAHSSGTPSNLSANGKKCTGKPGASSEAGSAGVSSAPKKRGNGRITVAEFVPPDVTGLSKREARLVKNRAAAFLSRQRKREEFECMEARLAEALQENARLKARQGQSGSPSPTPQDDAQVQRLRTLLREAEDRERALRMEVEHTRQQQVQQPTQPAPLIVKAEEPEFFLRMPGSLDIGSPEPMVQDRRVFSTKEKERHGGPGLSLMILVFSLTLLSLPHGQQLQGRLNDGQSAPTRVSFAPSGTAATPFPVLSNLIEKWEGGMDVIDDEGSDNEMEVELEADHQEDNGDGESNQDKKTYTVDFEMPVLADNSQTDEDGKIRVRIQPCGAPRPRREPRVPQAQVTAAVDGLRPFTIPPFTADNMFDPSVYAADAENWAGWTEFLNEEVFSADSQANAHLVPADMPAAALSPMSEPEATVFLGSDTASERYLTPPPFAGDTETSGLSPSPDTEPMTGAAAETGDKESLDVDVPLSQLPAWSRALVRAVAGEKVRAKIRMSRGPKWGAQKTAKVKARAGSTSKFGFTLRV